MKKIKSFLLKELILTGLVGIIAFILFQTIFKAQYLPVFWGLLIGIAVLTAVFHYALIQVSQKEPLKFPNRFIMATGIKMMIYLVFIIAYVFLHILNAKLFLIFFIVLYVIYTIFEVILILKALKQ